MDHRHQLYFNNTGKHQAIYNKYRKLVPVQGEAPDPRLELLRNLSNVYNDYYSNGNEEWHSIIKNNKISMDYVAPRDAPKIAKDFFKDIKEEFELYEDQQYKHNESTRSNRPFEPDVQYIDPEVLEQVVDATLEYIDQDEIKHDTPKAIKAIKAIKTIKAIVTKQQTHQVKKPRASAKPKPIKQKDVISSCKILNPDTGKYVDINGPTAARVLQKYAPDLKFK